MTTVAESDRAHDSRPEPEVTEVYRAAWDLQAFAGPVDEDTLLEMFRSAGVGPSWLVGERWAVIADLWRRGVSPAKAAAALARRS